MRIVRVSVEGRMCPHVVCDGCGAPIVFEKGKRPVVIVSRPGEPAFHEDCDPGDRGELSLEEVLRDLAFNSAGIR